MLISASVRRSPVGGRAQLSRLIHEALTALYGPRLMCREVSSMPPHGLKSLIWALRGHVDGLGTGTMADIVATIRHDDVGKVLVDGSNFGKLAAAIKEKCPAVEVSTFFHNCEARFFLGAARQRPSIRAFGVLVANYLAERAAVRYSDKRICLSKRDGDQLRRLYGRGATHVSAMAVRDKLPASTQAQDTPPAERYALFVGGAFYANQAGIAWFARNVAPHVPMKTCVVGMGLEVARAELEGLGNIEVVGEVGDLAPWYRNAHIVVAPIFDGSGMKTKVAEALMFGKRIVGTPEAFSGYEDVAARAGEICADAEGFIAAINREGTRPFVAIDPQLRAIYEAQYSFGAASSRLCHILGASVRDGGG